MLAAFLLVRLQVGDQLFATHADVGVYAATAPDAVLAERNFVLRHEQPFLFVGGQPVQPLVSQHFTACHLTATE